RGAAATVKRCRRTRGHRAPAVPHHLRGARAHQYQLADPVQGAQRHDRDAQQIRHGGLADAAGHRMFRLSARWQLFDAPSLGRPRRTVASRATSLRRCDPRWQGPYRDRRGRRGEPRNRHPLPRASSFGECEPSPGRSPTPDPFARLPPADNHRLPMKQHAARLDPVPIPFIDVAAQRRRLGLSIDEAIARVLAHCQFILGPEVRALETKLAEFCGARHVVTCASGTDALILVLMAQRIGPGDAVICPSFTFTATAEVVALVGATPVFADVEEKSFNLDPASLQRACGAARAAGLRPKAVIPVDLFGQPADYDRIMPIAEAESLFVLDDAAQAFGATYKNRRLGVVAPATATSFFPAKPLGCYGDGGAVITD